MPPVEEDGLDEGDHDPGAVESGAHDADLENFALRNSGFLWGKIGCSVWPKYRHSCDKHCLRTALLFYQTSIIMIAA